MLQKKKETRYTLIYWKDDGWYVGRLREYPAVFSQGKTIDELVENIRDAYHLVTMETRKSIPTTSVRTKTISLVT